MRRKTLQIETLEQRLNMNGDMPDIDGPADATDHADAAEIQATEQSGQQNKSVPNFHERCHSLQDIQVAIEVRFITLGDNFFEEIGVNFDVDIDGNAGDNMGDSFRSTLFGENGLGSSTGFDLDTIQRPSPADFDHLFAQDSLVENFPSLGGIGGFDASNAGSVGFAILSDIEAFFLTQAAREDARADVMTAPKVTLFNGQTASVSDATQMPFVTSIVPVVG